MLILSILHLMRCEVQTKEETQRATKRKFPFFNIGGVFFFLWISRRVKKNQKQVQMGVFFLCNHIVVGYKNRKSLRCHYFHKNRKKDILCGFPSTRKKRNRESLKQKYNFVLQVKSNWFVKDGKDSGKKLCTDFTSNSHHFPKWKQASCIDSPRRPSQVAWASESKIFCAFLFKLKRTKRELKECNCEAEAKKRLIKSRQSF